VEVVGHVLGRARVGETCSGDAGAVRTIEGVTWALLVDGLGHGPAAAEVAARALDEHQGFDAGLTIERAFGRLHARLAGSRGAAATLLRFEADTLGFSGVGNITLRVLEGPSVPYVSVNGILGRPPLRPRAGEMKLSGSGRVLLFTDGIVRTVPLHLLARLDAEALCRSVLADHSIERDDATLVHLNYRT